MNTIIKSRQKSARKPLIFGLFMVAALFCAGLIMGLSSSSAYALTRDNTLSYNLGNKEFKLNFSSFGWEDGYIITAYYRAGHYTDIKEIEKGSSQKIKEGSDSVPSVSFSLPISESEENSIFIDVTDYYDNHEYSNIIYVGKNIVPLPETPTKEGHTFKGWYFDTEFKRPYDGSPIYADTELHAKFEINRYTVSFDANGGDAVESREVDWNTTLTDLPTPTREGYNFVGWFTNTTQEYNGEAVKADTTLVAHWEIKVFTVTFKVNGEVYKTVQVEWGQSFAAALEAANLQYYNALDEAGQKIGKAATVKADITVPIGEMTEEEKRATFIGNNWWILWGAGGLIVALALGLTIAAFVAHKRR